MNRYKCIIIEDEPLAQNILKKYIADHPSLELAGVFSDALQAQDYLHHQSVDILFLDINLPKISGINFLKTLVHPPLIIFTTAYPEYAVEGFELDALDYLLKPFSFERFLKAVNKALEKRNQLASVKNSSSGIPSFIFLKADKKIHKVDLENILYIEAVGDYMKVVTASGQLLVNETMKNMADMLPENLFLRVHKSFIISRSKIQYLEGNYVHVAGASIPIGATYRQDVFMHIEKKKE